MTTETITIFKGEGDVKTVTSVRRRKTCEECGEVAVFKQTYLLNGTRRNPASSAYGRDDCSWCSDKDVYLCGSCRIFAPEGYGECARFQASDRFAHMFLEWVEMPTDREDVTL